jgi:hypothetical protein
MSRSAIEAWLGRLSDPRGVNEIFPAEAIAVDDRKTVDRLIFEAQRHSVHPVLFGHLTSILRNEPEAFIVGGGTRSRERADALIQSVGELRLQDTGQVMVLAEAAREIKAATAGLPVALVKGLDFAEVLFGGLQYRSFGDIDLLLDPSGEADLCAILTGLGFKEPQAATRDRENRERQWLRPHPQLGYVMVEMHEDMVHSKRIRRSMSLTYALYAGEASGGISGASRLILAAVHASSSHLFGRLQYVVDGMMAARAGVDGRELAERAGETGAMLPLRTLLRLAAEIYGSEECRGLLEHLPQTRGSALEARLVTGKMVLAAKSPQRWRFIPQRRFYRHLLQAAGG